MCEVLAGFHLERRNLVNREYPEFFGGQRTLYMTHQKPRKYSGVHILGILIIPGAPKEVSGFFPKENISRGEASERFRNILYDVLSDKISI